MTLYLPNNDARFPSPSCATSSGSCLSGGNPRDGAARLPAPSGSREEALVRTSPLNPAVTSYETKTPPINLCQIWTIGVAITGEEKEMIVRAFVGLSVPWKTMLKTIFKCWFIQLCHISCLTDDILFLWFLPDCVFMKMNSVTHHF